MILKRSLNTILFILLLSISLPLCVYSCTDNETQEEKKDNTEDKDDNADNGDKDDTTDNKFDKSMFYCPDEFKNMDFTNPDSKWCYDRSKQSDNFIVFWEKGYEYEPGDSKTPEEYRVDIDDLLAKAEEFYDVNIHHLKFANEGTGESNVDKYKMLIMLHYTTDWMAYGGGYDNEIGALWISPSTCKPVGSTIAHEIGHSFQYQTYCDLKTHDGEPGAVAGDPGFRHAIGQGNTFWEQTAQYQSLISYPKQIFETVDYNDVYRKNCFRHFTHEHQRYASYYLHYYWTEKHGEEIVGKVWRESKSPEDPLEAYMRLTDIDNTALNAEMYDAAAKFATWDVDGLREYGKLKIGTIAYGYNKLGDGSYQVSYDFCPENTGYNIIDLDISANPTSISVEFTGLPNESGYNTVDASLAGWSYGFVALLDDDTRVYGDMNQTVNIGAASFNVPANTVRLFMVVTPTPTEYIVHKWDEDNTNDPHWPYKFKLTNTKVVGDS
ncbi:MAG: DUF6055 domain-containing protein [Mangrovibacterium sp.]